MFEGWSIFSSWVARLGIAVDITERIGDNRARKFRFKEASLARLHGFQLT